MTSNQSISSVNDPLVSHIDSPQLTSSPIYILETSTPSTIFINYTALNIPIETFIASLPTLSTKHLKKLLILTSHKDISPQSLIKLTFEKDRLVRHLSTVSSLNRIKTYLLYAKKTTDNYESEIFEIFDNVYYHRSKDVDVTIRLICYEYLCEFVRLSVLFRRKEFYKLIVDGINDRIESVRKKCVRGLGRIFDKCVKSDEMMLKGYGDCFKDRICELCMNESNLSIRNEAISLLIRLYQFKLCMKEDVMNILINVGEKDVYSLYAGFKEEKGVVIALFEIYACHPDVLTKLKLSIDDRQEYVEYLKNEEDCTESHINILYRIINRDYSRINDLFAIIKKFKHMFVCVKKLICMLNVIDLEQFTVDDSDLIEFIISILRENHDPELLDSGFKFLKKVHNKFITKIDFLIENIKHEKHDLVIKHAIRNFDISDIVTEDDILEVKVLSYLWQIKNDKFDNVRVYNLVINTKDDLREAANFLIYCYDILVQQNCIDEVFQVAYDPFSALKLLFDRLKDILKIYFIDLRTQSNEFEKEKENFNFKEALKRKKLKITQIDNFSVEQLCRIAHIIKIYDNLFDNTRQSILNCIQRIKEIDQEFIDSFFKHLATKEFNIMDIKIISQSIVKKSGNVRLGAWLHELSDRKVLYDNCFVYFAKYLENNECRSLHNKIKFNCKYKKMLEKRIKEMVIVCENEQEDVIRF